MAGMVTALLKISDVNFPLAVFPSDSSFGWSSKSLKACSVWGRIMLLDGVYWEGVELLGESISETAVLRRLGG